MDHALTLEHVTKRFGSYKAVDDLSLAIPTGSIYGFLGPNGAGKTTTIRMVTNIIQPDEGNIRVLGEKSSELTKDRLGYLPEEKGLYKKMKCAEILAYFGKLKGMDSGAAKAKAYELLERYGLAEWSDKRCEALSKGMSQKVQMLGTIIHDPNLLILDEPFSGLDPVNVEILRDLILDQRKAGRTVIFSTHGMEQAEQICDFIFLIDKGKKVIDGPLSQVRKSAEQAVMLDYDGDGSRLATLPGVVRVNDSGKSAELFLAPGTDPQVLLRALIGMVKVRRFDQREPSLHEVFVRAVGGRQAAKDLSHG
ncbi:MAG TPA: ATP-binding cassette domain-containing protein [Planctomycetota bacterium]|nr:ATP-binding cassette domain-containing protein [Planctomycetota bacterium]